LIAPYHFVESPNQKQLFALLPAATPRWGSFLVGWSLQALSLVCLLFLGARVQQDFVSSERYQVTTLVSFEPLTLQKQQPARSPTSQSKPLQKSEPFVKSQLAAGIRPSLKTELQVEEKDVPGTIVLTSPVRSWAERKAPQADPTAPELKLESKMPAIPNSPVPQAVGLGTFADKLPAATTARPALAVSVGGFGVSNSTRASEQRGAATAPMTGSFDQPIGPADRRGATGTNPRVVTQAAFSSPVVVAAVKSAPVSRPRSPSNIPVEITFKPKPDYTEEGRKKQINGEVRLQVLFSADGRVRVLHVVEGLGYGLDEQAVKAAEQIKFKPAVQEGRPVDSTALVHIIFELIS
jgi:TonB family protein